MAAEQEEAECVIVGETDANVRAATCRLLRRIGFKVLEAATGTEALELSRSVRPAAVLLDVALPEISGYQVCQMLRSEYGADLPILLLADSFEPHNRTAGILLGADDCLSRPFAPDELLARIKLHASASSARTRTAAGMAATLTPSELRVLRLLATGHHTKAIGNELSIAPKTVATHIQNAMQKLDVHTRTQAVALAHQLGLVNDNSADVEADSISTKPGHTQARRRPTA